MHWVKKNAQKFNCGEVIRTRRLETFALYGGELVYDNNLYHSVLHVPLGWHFGPYRASRPSSIRFAKPRPNTGLEEVEEYLRHFHFRQDAKQVFCNSIRVRQRIFLRWGTSRIELLKRAENVGRLIRQSCTLDYHRLMPVRFLACHNPCDEMIFYNFKT